MPTTTPPITPRTPPPHREEFESAVKGKNNETENFAIEPLPLNTAEEAMSAPHLIVGEIHQHIEPKKFVIEAIEGGGINVLFMEHIDSKAKEYFKNPKFKQYFTDWLDRDYKSLKRELDRLDQKDMIEPDTPGLIDSDDREKMLKIIKHLKDLDSSYLGNKLIGRSDSGFVGLIKSALAQGVEIVPVDDQSIYNNRISGRVTGTDRIEGFNKHATKVAQEYLGDNTECRSIFNWVSSCRQNL